MLANGAAEAAGLGTTFALGAAAAGFFEADQTVAAMVSAALLAVLLGTLLEGVVVGLAQGAVLHRHRREIPLRSWVIATSTGAGLAWAVGMIPSTVMSLSGADAAQPSMQEPALLVTLLLAAALGAVTGPILGVAQWVVLRRRFRHAVTWLWANALAWALGMTVIFAGMDLVPWDGPSITRAAVIYAVCFTAGIIVGGVHGLVLVRITRA